jgi:O-antigen ligase
LAVVIIGWQGRRALVPLASLAGAGLVALIPLSRVIPRLENLTDFDNSTTLFRVNLWRSTAQLLQDHPLTGVGLDQFLYAYRGRYILPEAWSDPDLSHPHNWLLDYWVRLGILGVVIGVWLQVIFWRTALTAYREVRQVDGLRLALVLGTMGSMANFLAHGLVDSAYFATNLAFIFTFNMALVAWLEASVETLKVDA